MLNRIDSACGFRHGRLVLGFWVPAVIAILLMPQAGLGGEPEAQRAYRNRLTRIANPAPLLADHPEFVQPIRETARFEAPALIGNC